VAKKSDLAGRADAPESFESALKELESLVAGLEGGNLTLEQSLAAHKRGLELARYCQSTLAQAQQQVRVLEDEALKAFPVDDAPT
jgi:exodeoxyribonuclease VII small subunit